MKKIILITALAGFMHHSFGQTVKPESTLSGLAKVDLGLQGIGLTYEPRISNKIVIDFSGGIGGGYDVSEKSFSYYYSSPAFYFSVTPKYYYNLQSRLKKGKKSQLNSGNYIGVRLKYSTPLNPSEPNLWLDPSKTDYAYNTILTNIHWGIQRAIGRNWLFNTQAGVGYARSIKYNTGTIYPSIDFTFAYVFIKSKR